jgi:alkyl sulfatase BDS1-like metallo-beta-lactamase superfamily hydrolase
MTIVEGETGVLVIDPLISQETAAAALALYRKNRGDRPVTGVLYTHSHIDHFGGVVGVLPDGRGDVPIFAPEGFLEHAVAENVYAGVAMLRRGSYHTGYSLPPGPTGLIGTGLGQTASTGTVTLIAPTLDITRTGQEETVDGVRMIFQLTPGTEAPSEMNFLFPDRRALCLAENATHNMHNILTLRGAVVRNARIWARYLNETTLLFGDRVDTAFASHHWPTWGRDRIVRYLTEQRDLYAYLHDQTLRLLNQGYNSLEIAEMIQLPATLRDRWHTHGYYGSVSHNVKAIYQYYLGWFDGNPAHLWELPPAESGKRYVDCMGGADATVAKARGFFDAGDLRFAAQLLNHVVFGYPAHSGARDLLADVYQQLGYGAENGTWRNFYLTGAQELRHGIRANAAAISSAGMAVALTVEQILDSLAIRVVGPKASSVDLCIDLTVTDIGETHRLTLSNGALIHYLCPDSPPTRQPDLALALSKPQLLGLLAGNGLDGIAVTGDPAAIDRLLGVLDNPDPSFAIVTT